MKFKKVLIIFWILFLGAVNTYALEMNELPIIPGSGSTAYSNYLYDSPPEIESVILIPEVPTPDNDVIIKAKIKCNLDKTDASVVDASLHYSINGESYQSIYMQQDKGDNDYWIAKIPKQSEGTVVDFYITAVDTYGNTVIEIPPAAEKSSLTDKENLQLLTEDDNDADQVVPQDLDILSSYLSYDNENINFKISVEKNISGGTLDPAFLNTYGALIYNLDKGPDVLGAYMPVYCFNLKLGSYPSAIFYDLGRILIDYDYLPKAIIDKGDLNLILKRKALGENFKKGYKVVFFTLGITSTRIRDDTTSEGVPVGVIKLFEQSLQIWRSKNIIDLDDVEVIRKVFYFEDLTPYVIFYLRSHQFTVQKLTK